MRNSLATSPYPRVQTSWRLPLEIHERVIDFVAASLDGRETLKACALACKSWLPRSRFHLLYEAHLHSRQEVYSFARLLRNNRLFRNKVVYVTVGASGGPGRRGSIAHLAAFAAAFAGRLPALHELTLRNAEWTVGAIRQDTFLHLSTFASLSHLFLVNIVIPSLSSFRHIVCAFSGLTLLQCTDVNIGGSGTALPLSPSLSRGRLRHVGIDGNVRSMSKIVDMLIGCGLAGSLVTIVLGYKIAVSLRECEDWVQRLLTAAGPTLRTFSGLLTLTDAGSDSQKLIEDVGQHFSFARNVGLERAILRIPVYEDSRLSWLPSLLSSVTFNMDGDIYITFEIDRGNGAARLRTLIARLQESFCSEIEVVFSHPQFDKLRRLQVELHIFGTSVFIAEAVWRAVIQSTLPLLQARGILK